MAPSGSPDTNRSPLTPAVRWIVLICLGVALLQATVVTAADMAGWVGFQPALINRAWWSVVSYAFVPTGTWSLVATLLALIMFGPHVERAWGTKTFTVLFLWSVIGGAVVHAVVSRSGILTGAAAGVFGIMLAYGSLFPKDEVYLFGVLPMRAWTLIGIVTTVILVLGVSQSTPGNGGMGYFAHLGGFAFALLYLKRPSPVSIEELRHRVAPAPDPTNEAPHAIPRTLPRSRRSEDVDEIVAQSKAAVAKRPVRTSRANGGRDTKREALNRVLDKISQQGLDSLSPEDRILLEDISRRLRGRGR